MKFSHRSSFAFIVAFVCAIFMGPAMAASVPIAEGMTFREYFFSSAVSADPLHIIIYASLAGFVGMVSHWLKRVVKDKEQSSFLDWFVFSKTKSTLVAIGTMVAGIVMAIMPLEIAQLSLYQAIIMGYTMGYAADSAFNGSDVGKS